MVSDLRLTATYTDPKPTPTEKASRAEEIITGSLPVTLDALLTVPDRSKVPPFGRKMDTPW